MLDWLRLLIVLSLLIHTINYLKKFKNPKFHIRIDTIILSRIYWQWVYSICFIQWINIGIHISLCVWSSQMNARIYISSICRTFSWEGGGGIWRHALMNVEGLEFYHAKTNLTCEKDNCIRWYLNFMNSLMLVEKHNEFKGKKIKGQGHIGIQSM